MEQKTELAPVVESKAVVEYRALKEQSIMAFESGLLPRAIDTRQKAVVVALAGRELGLSPMAALTGIYVVNGMVALRGSLMLRLIYERVPGAQLHVLTPPDKAKEECEIEMQRPGGKPMRFKFTMADAKAGGFATKPIWQQHTATMLRWAAIRTGARVVFADALAGCYMEDEIPRDARPDAPEPMLAPAIPAYDDEVIEGEYTGGMELTPEEKAACDVDKASTPPPPSHGAAAPVDHRKVTPAQVGQLFAIANSKGFTSADVEAYTNKKYRVYPVALDRQQYDETVRNIMSAQPKAAARPAATPQPAPQQGGKKPFQSLQGCISEKQNARLFAIAKKACWPYDEMKAYIKQVCGENVEHTNQIVWQKYNDICTFIEKNPYPENDMQPLKH